MIKEKKDISLFFISKVIIGIISLLLITLYSSMISPTDYGDYSLVSGLINAFVSIFVGWVGSSALRYYIDYEDNKRTFFFNVMIYSCAMILLVIILISIFSIFSSTIPIYSYYISTIFYTINFSLLEVFEKIFRAAQKTKAYTIAVIIQAIINIGLFYLFATIKPNANSIFLSASFSRLIFIAIAFIILGVHKYLKPLPIDKDLLKKFLKYGIPMIGVWGVTWILSYCDRYMIALSYTNYEVGIYDMSYKIAENSINMVITAFTLAIFPILINAWKKYGKLKVESYLTEIIRYYNILVLPAVIGLCCISEKLFLGIIDKSYISGKTTIIVVCIGMYFNGLNSILNKIWQLNEKTKNILYVLIVSVITNISLNLVLVPKYGFLIAAITTLISYLISVMITYKCVRKDINIIIDLKSLSKTVISTAIMGTFLLYFNRFVHNLFMLLLEIIISMILYLICSLLMKNIKLNEIKKEVKNG